MSFVRLEEPLTARVWIDLPVVAKRATGEKEICDNYDPASGYQEKSNVDADQIMFVEAGLQRVSVNPALRGRVVRSYCQAKVKHQERCFERPKQRRVGRPSGKLNLGANDPNKDKR